MIQALGDTNNYIFASSAIDKISKYAYVFLPLDVSFPAITQFDSSLMKHVNKF